MNRKAIISVCIAIPFLFSCQANGNIKNDQSKQLSESEPLNQPSNKDVEKEDNKEVTIDRKNITKTETVEGKTVIQNPNNVLILVNKQLHLPEDYKPTDLVRPKVPFSFGDQDIEKSYLRKIAAEHLEKMFKQAKNDGIEIFAVSGYRSYNRQVQVFQNQVAKSGEETALTLVAVPGQSEHQTGLAMDISAKSVGFDLVEEFENTVEGQWLSNNAYKFGFILRYPKGKEDVTGYSYEPWHFRYVGKEIAKIIYENNWTLEEYFAESKGI
ncbi:M15 family metallopeptidase [Bacillus kwashiorkori]|uniref:M15 family metallopeptidase n=1 Tax=Bacillus kwashiorkori TaxID=1522318 RepID=UPI000782544E|nr:M15 family metallopeptidase [Bacillus kwashiorkori]